MENSFTVPDFVTDIGSGAFAGYCNLTTIIVPNTVTHIGDLAFSGCSSLSSITIPNSITYIGRATFSGCNGLTSIILPSSITSIGESAFSYCNGLTSVILPSSITSIGESAFSNCDNLTSVTIPNSVIQLGNYAFSQCSKLTSISLRNTKDLLSSGLSNSTFYGINTNCILYVPMGLKEKYEQSIHKQHFSQIEEMDFLIKSIEVNGNLTPTGCLILRGICTEDFANIIESGFKNFGQEDSITLKSLDPGKEFNITYYAISDDGYREEKTLSFTTPALELTTLQPRCVSSSCAIVAATTNISEEETNVGFQWKKYDAPASLKPNEGYSAIYDRQLEGYIRNLQPTSYYNVRAFYKSAAGNYYYGAWVTFDPSDFSYFEPTVHTYAAEAVTANSARVKGYVLAGTDEIEEQGFEYWPTGTDESQAKSVRAAKAEAETDGIQTVFATGQVMTAELRDLRSATTYCLRAFVKTAAGKTYGEEQTFTTPGLPTDITDAATSTTAPTVEGYYDLNGRKFETPQRGINIIRYSNGTTRKIVVR